MDKSLLIKSPGMLTTIQDAGRKGFLHTGLPAAGCMDVLSMRLANWLAGNAWNTAVLEITLLGPKLVVNSNVASKVTIGIAGAECQVLINNNPVDASSSLHLNAGDELSFGALTSGCRVYLAVAGGFALPSTLNSHSTYMPAALGGIEGRQLQAGDVLPIGVSDNTIPQRQLPQELRIQYGKRASVRVVAGAEGEWFSDNAWQQLLSQEFTISPQSNRMGYRLTAIGDEACNLEKTEEKEMLTTGLVPGSIQVNHQGEPIIIMADGQTSGGYPRIANVISADQHLLGQLQPGDKVRFYKVELDQAIALYREKQQWLDDLLPAS